MPFATKSLDYGLPFTMLRDKTTTAGYYYNGWAEPGTNTTANKARPIWKIQREKIDPDGDTIAVDWASGTSEFTQVWDNRANLSYS